MTQHNFYAAGKLLLTSEYFVLDGVTALALPTKLGQSLNVTIDESSSSGTSTLHWKSDNVDEKCWMDVSFDLDNFDIVTHDGTDYGILQSILRETRTLNPDFLKGSQNVNVSTTLEFAKDWGLGTSSTLLHMVSEWASVCPFTLLKQTIGGSGYDIACAGASGPIFYHNRTTPPTWSHCDFDPQFKDQLYFVYRNQKQSSREGIKRYRELPSPSKTTVDEFNMLVENISTTNDLDYFQELITRHERIISEHLGLDAVKDELFSDYWGAIKSLGAWGGDFVLCTSDQGDDKTFDYFTDRGYNTILKYNELILAPNDDK